MIRPVVAARFLLISKGLFLVVVGLVPLVVLPWTTDPLEPSKQLVLVLGIALAAVSYLASLVLERRSLAKPGLLVGALALLLLVTGLSASYSLMPATSWLGQGGQEYVSGLSLAAFIGLFLLGKELMNQPNFKVALSLAVLSSSSIVGLTIIPLFVGATPSLFTHLVGAPHASAIYLLVISILAGGWWMIDVKFAAKWQHRWFQMTSGVTTVTCGLTLLALDSPVLWWLALIGSGLLLGVAVWQAQAFQNPIKLAPAMLLGVVAVIFLLFKSPVHSPFPQEVTPNLEATWSVVTGAWNEGSVVWGTGPGTFQLVYPKYVPLGVNSTDFWELVFDRGNSYVTTQLATVGLAGILAWLLFVVLLAVLAGKKLLKLEHGWQELLPILAAWMTVVVAAIVYPQNLSLALLFWLLSAWLACLCVPRHELPHRWQAQGRMATMLIAALMLAGIVMAMLTMLPRYKAEMTFTKAVKLNANAETALEVDEVIRLLDKAAALNPYSDVYRRNLAGALLRRIAVLSADELADDAYVQSLIMTTIATATKATDISPANVLNWDVRGLVYRDLLPVVPDAAQPAIEAYERATELAPVNPRYRVEAAKAYMSWADAQTPFKQNEDPEVANEAELVQSQALAKAEEHLTIAIALKPDYAPGHYYLALLRQRQGDLAEAVRGLELVRSQVPQDIGVGLQLGLLYLRQGKNELAQIELERVLALAPAYANAHWYLSVVFEQSGDLKNAIVEVEKVLETNPDDVTVKTRLDRLKAGETSEVIPEPVSSEPAVPAIP